MASQGPNENPDIFIYKAMDRSVGYNFLKNRANQMLNIDDIKANGTILWLLRESNTQKGMLTVDFIYWNKALNRWNEVSTRMVLHAKNGWIDSSNPANPEVQEAIKNMVQVDSAVAAKHLGSLETYLTQHKDYKFEIANRVNPFKQDQAQSSVYSSYVTQALIATKVSVVLTPPIIQAISCELSKKTMKNPVVLKKDILITEPGDRQMLLRKGRSYERSELEARDIGPDCFIENFSLQKIISRLGCGDKGKIDNLETDRLFEPVMLETMSQPYILPSTHSISRETLEQMKATGRSLRCPETQAPFERSDPVPNLNLDQFIREWPDCQQVLVASLQNQTPPTSPRSSL